MSHVQKWLAPKFNEIWRRKFEQSETNNTRYDLGELHTEGEPHISLTKVGVSLQLHWINEFTNSMRNAFLNMKKVYASVGKIEVYFNEAKTRIFIGKINSMQNWALLKNTIADTRPPLYYGQNSPKSSI